MEKAYKKNNGNLSAKETLHSAISILQQVASADFKATDIEIGMATTEQPRFVSLSEEEIERTLNEMAER